MADRTSAGLFADVFTILAEDPTKENKKLAAKIFKLTDSYDFDYCQMECYEVLIKLDLARMKTDQENEYEVIYGPIEEAK